MSRLMLAICIMGILIAIGVIGRADYEDQVRAETAYCEDVRAGLYRDWKGICHE